MTKKTEGIIWLRSQIRFAAIASFVFSILIFIGITLSFPGVLEWNSYPVFIIGSLMGIVFTLRRPQNPFSLNPKSDAISHRLSYEERSTFLEKHWALIPRSVFWLAGTIYPLLLLLFNIITRSIYTSPDFSYVGLLMGFGTSITFCGSMSFMVIYRNSD